MSHKFFGVIAIAIFLIGCEQAAVVVTPNSEASLVDPVEVSDNPEPTVRLIPTLYPTATLGPTALPTDTRPPQPTDIPDTPVAFDESVVELRYAILGLDLDRTIVGNVASQIEITDQTTGISTTRSNQIGVLLELQQALPELQLAEIPDACEYCVYLEYRLPKEGKEDAGWLENTQLLASIENFTAAMLGPHFPPDTIVGMRRSATPYHVAHTVAMTSDGQLWRWTATEAEVEGPQPSDDEVVDIVADLEELDIGAMKDIYSAACPQGSGVETLFLSNSGSASQIQIVCPELALPANLLPIYQLMDQLADDKVSEERLETPEPSIPLEALLYYHRSDGIETSLLIDDQISISGGDGITFTDTLTNSFALSLTIDLVKSGALKENVSDFPEIPTGNFVKVRGPENVWEAVWTDEPDSLLLPYIEQLDELIDQKLFPSRETEDDGGTSTPEPTEVP
jgi:hypothetical protein